MSYLGDFAAGDTIDFKFSTRRFSTGATFTLAGTPAISIYKSNSTTQSTAGITLTVDFDSVTGLNHVRIDTTADGTFYADGGQFDCVITTGTVDSVSVVGESIGRFTLRAQAPLYPTTAGRKLDVSTGGEAGLDWANVGTPGSTVSLSATTVATVTTTTTATNVTTVNGLAANVITATSMAADASAEIADAVWDEDATGHQTQGSFGQVIGDSVADSDSIWSLCNTNLDAAVSSRMATFTLPTNFAALGINGSGHISRVTLTDTLTTYTGNTVQTGDSFARIGAAGAGLTDLGGMSTTMKGQVQTEAEDALVTHRLDELLNADSDIDGAAPPTVGSVFHELMTKTTGSFTYDQTTDSLEALRDRGDAAWTTSTLAAADVWAAATRTLTSAANITSTGGTTVPQTGDSFARLGVPAGASVSADIAAIEAQTDDIGAAGAGLTAIPWNASWDAEVQSEVQDALDATLADSVPADGTRPSIAQAIYMLTQFLTERAVSGTTVTVKKVDGSTTLMTFTLNDATTPTSITRAT